ncbi:ectonucleotide pyrophosphatase/phosphodiesterase [Oleiagrimonas soli]|uniref:Putative AlkP superfamily pyrophosphatase or phosphodiesterase n=1 Tax=Oleiagrimonas soli TaxID=1543381 RepID=A0A841KL68_9GAMM|nr:ectonucleotide pyrophosphatase/phosphodiesterase [Oleiagrimonas soli]MBB6182818.1 putative AlkP superfamily pyrophosphatase or phosphodiesterase [Oleiagrimonas soli]
MKRTLSIAFLSIFLLLAGCAGNAPRAPATTAQTRPAPLLLISIDAFRADYLQRGFTPNLQQLADTGVRAKAMQPAFPSLTFPNHYTLVTGLYPDHHGIVDNNMLDPKLGRFSLGNRKAVADPRWWNEAEPIWVTADKHGLKTATMFWPGSGTKIRGYRPDHWLPYNGKLTPTQRVDRVLQWLDLPPGERPTFLTLYFDRVDHEGHDFGPDSPQVDAAMHRIDAAIGRLIAGLKQRGLYRRMNIIVVSDHGMAPSPASHVILLDKLIDLQDVTITSMGELAGLIPKPGRDAAVEAALLKPHPHMHCWKKQDIPARFHYGSNPRVPPIVCSPQTGWDISTSGWLATHKTTPGSHGYDNADPLMRALFIAHGPAFRDGLVVPEFPNVDVYPLMTHLLDLPAQPNDGSYDAVKDMLRPDAR